MTFGEAIEALKRGERVTRPGWNGKGMYLVLVNQITTWADRGEMEALPVNPAIWMRTATGEWQPGWLASQTDMLAEDWMIVE